MVSLFIEEFMAAKTQDRLNAKYLKLMEQTLRHFEVKLSGPMASSRLSRSTAGYAGVTRLFCSRLPDLSSVGKSWDTSQIYSAGTISVINAVPEPSRAVLMLFGAAGLLLRRWRKGE